MPITDLFAGTGIDFTAYRALVDYQNRYQLPLRVPQICTLGSQSTGKTTVIELLSREPVGFSADGMATKCPVQYTFSKKEEPSFRVNNNPCRREEIMTRIQEHMGRLPSIVRDVLHVEISGPNCLDLIITDLPGFNFQNDTKVILEIAVEYIAKNAIVLGLTEYKFQMAETDQNFASLTELLRNSNVDDDRVIRVANKCMSLDARFDEKDDSVHKIPKFTELKARRTYLEKDEFYKRRMDEEDKQFKLDMMNKGFSADHCGVGMLLKKLADYLHKNLTTMKHTLLDTLNVEEDTLRSRIDRMTQTLSEVKEPKELFTTLTIKYAEIMAGQFKNAAVRRCNEHKIVVEVSEYPKTQIQDFLRMGKSWHLLKEKRDQQVEEKVREVLHERIQVLQTELKDAGVDMVALKAPEDLPEEMREKLRQYQRDVAEYHHVEISNHSLEELYDLSKVVEGQHLMKIAQQIMKFVVMGRDFHTLEDFRIDNALKGGKMGEITPDKAVYEIVGQKISEVHGGCKWLLGTIRQYFIKLQDNAVKILNNKQSLTRMERAILQDVKKFHLEIHDSQAERVQSRWNDSLDLYSDEIPHDMVIKQLICQLTTSCSDIIPTEAGKPTRGFNPRHTTPVLNPKREKLMMLREDFKKKEGDFNIIDLVKGGYQKVKAIGGEEDSLQYFKDAAYEIYLVAINAMFTDFEMAFSKWLFPWFSNRVAQVALQIRDQLADERNPANYFQDDQVEELSRDLEECTARHQELLAILQEVSSL
jgi:hypothetical protein